MTPREKGYCRWRKSPRPGEVLDLDEVAEADEGEVLAVAEDVAEAVDELELVDADQFQLPETEELRDILTGLDEEDGPPKREEKG